jgi:hypothetical protein
MASSDFEQFVATFFGTGPDAAREGPDEAALARLRGDEREQAKEMLFERLGPSDPRPAVGLGVLQAKEAAEPIRALMEQYEESAENIDASFLTDTSLALFRIEKAPEALGNVVRVLVRSPYPTNRTHAALTLRQFRDPRAAQALDGSMQNDPDRIVRHNAAKSLLALHGLLPDQTENPPLTIRVMIDAPAVRDQAVEELRALVRERPL